MIKNESLGNRLNEFKNKTNKSLLPSEAIFQTLGVVYLAIQTVIKTFVFGYGLKLLFHTDWNFWGVVCIGVGINFLLTYIHDLIHDKPDNSNL